ncbi:LamG domain-containing protein [Colwellia sp. RE-S-Sl-9]
MKHIHFFTLVSLVLLTACGGSEVESNPPVQTEILTNVYTGPAPQTDDIQRYKANLWDNVSTSDKCGGCHRVDDQAPYFARHDDVNLAYADTTALVDLSKPELSRLVTKVASGHNCWLGSDQACGETMTQWIKLWADNQVSIANTIELKAPVIKEAGASRSFPESTDLFNDHVYPLLQTYCSNCHQETAVNAQAPFFASQNIEQAYLATQRVINIDNPTQSRLVIRLGSEFHNCWTNCQENSNEMLEKITAMRDEIEINTIADEMVISKALKLTDGVVASSGGRFETDVIALYQFKTGESNTAYDTSGISPAANLTLSGDYEWLGSWGIQLNNGKAQASTASSKKLHDLITATGKFSVEAWVTPSNVVQEGPAKIISYSASETERNFTLGQTQYNYDFMLRNEQTSTNGEPALSTPDNDEVLQATLQHVVLTYDATEGRKIYVNGNLINITDNEVAPLSAWDDSFALILGQEATNNNVWQGSVRLLAIYNNVLTQDQIQQNYDIGVGEKFFLLFSISEKVNLANTFIVFEVSQFDNYSYLFNSPSLVNLDNKTLPESLNIKGIKLGINGKESAQGQAFKNVDVTISSTESIASPLPLSSLGTIIGLDKGAQNDEFFLSFETLGTFSNITLPGEVIITPEVPSATNTSDIGIKNFAELNATMSVLTGIPAQTSKVRNTYQLVQRQLPSIDNIETFISAQQMGITQLAITYCDSAIEDPTIRNTWFEGIDFDQAPSIVFDTNNRSQFITLLIDKLLPLNITTQPEKDAVTTEIDALITRLSSCTNACEANRSRTIAKASCTAILASAVVLVQ